MSAAVKLKVFIDVRETESGIARIDKLTRSQLGIDIDDYVTIKSASSAVTVRARYIPKQFINKNAILISSILAKQLNVVDGQVVMVTAGQTHASTRKQASVLVPWEKASIPETVIISIDTSKSMADDAGLSRDISKIEAVRSAIIEFINVKRAMNENDLVGLVRFGMKSQVLQAPTLDYNRIIVSLRDLIPEGGNTLFAGIKEPWNMLTRAKTPLRRLLLLTDGIGGDPTNTVRKRAKKHPDIRIDTIGVGFDVDSNILKEIAEITNGQYLFVDELRNLNNVFGKLSREKAL